MMAEFDLSTIRACTFDCYGTLIDWESGLLAAIRSLLASHGVQSDDADVLRGFSLAERQIESGPFILYREVCAKVTSRIATHFNIALREGEQHALADSIANWTAYGEVHSALRTLKQRYKLGVLSNVDDDLFAHTAPKLGVELDGLVTSEQVQSYKPAHAHFDEILARLNLEPSQILHIAESRHHDIAPARTLGFLTCWIKRHATGEPSASGSSDAQPHITATSLTDLIQQIDQQ